MGEKRLPGSRARRCRATNDSADAFEGLGPEDRLKKHIVDGIKKNLDRHLDDALEIHSALHIINEILLDGMKTVENVAAQIEWALLDKPVKAAPEKPAAARLDRESPVSAKGTRRGPVKLGASAPVKAKQRKPAPAKPPSRSVGKKSASALKSSRAKAARKAGKASLLGARRKAKARVKAAKRRR